MNPTPEDIARDNAAVAYVRCFSELDPARSRLTEVVKLAILDSEAARSKVIVDIGHTVVEDLRKRGLWTETAATTRPAP